MKRSLQDILARQEINKLTKQGQLLKREGKLTEAIKLLENGIEHYEPFYDIQADCIGSLNKSLAKLYYVQERINQAVLSYIEAVDMYMVSGGGNQVDICLFHLGCCSDAFRKDKRAEIYASELQSGGGLPWGHPDSPFTEKNLKQVINIGHSIYNQFRKSVSANWVRPRVCPVCGLEDEVMKVHGILELFLRHPTQFQGSKDFGMALLNLVENQPPSNKELVAVRLEHSFYCYRCDNVFFVENGTTYHEYLSQAKNILYK